MMVWSTPWKALRFRLERGGRNAVIYEWKNNCFGWPSPVNHERHEHLEVSTLVSTDHVPSG